MSNSILGTWPNPPLAYVVAEVGISAHYSIAQFIPAIQESLRDVFPRTDEGMEVALPVGAPNQATASDRIWRLLTPDNGRGVFLGTRAIALHATLYQDFSEFSSWLTRVLQAVQASKLNPFVERIGLRYIDYILPSNDHQFVEYLVPELRGVTPPSAEAAQATMWSATYPFGTYTASARVAAPMPLGMILPPNFSPLPLKKPSTMLAAEQRSQKGQPIGIIDTDCGQTPNEVFNAENLVSKFTQMHKCVSATFNALISDLAVKEWKG
ncbi:MAG: TIGR04255 family protein [Sulfuricaulis sp.]